MPTIATISTAIKADISNFEKGMRKARRELADFADAIPFANTAVSTFAAATVTAAAAGIALLAKAEADAIDKTAKLADRLNDSVQSIRALQYAGDLSGVSAEDMGKALDKLTKSVGEAAGGNKEALSSFEELGLSLPKLASQSASENFADIAEKIKAIKDPAQQAALATSIFGKSGQQLLNVLSLGKDGLRETGTEFEKLAGTATRSQAGMIEQANDSITKIKTVVAGFGLQVAQAVAPYVTAVAESLIKWGFNAQGAQSLIVNASKIIAVGIGRIADYLELIKAGWYGLRTVVTFVATGIVGNLSIIGNAFDEFLDAIGVGKTGVGDVLSNMRDDLNKDAEDLAVATAAAYDAFSRGDNSNAAGKFFDDLSAKAKEAGDAMQKAADAKRKLQQDSVGISEDQINPLQSIELDKGAFESKTKELEKVNEKIRDAAQKLKDNAASIFEATRNPLEKLNAQMAKLQELLAKDLINPETFRRAAQAAEEEFQKATTKDAGQAVGFAGSFDTSLINLDSYAKAGATEQQVHDPALDKVQSILIDINRNIQQQDNAAVVA